MHDVPAPSRNAAVSSGGGERGAATILVLAVISLLLTVTIGGLVIAGAIVASHRARLAADLSALAGAGALVDGSTSDVACARAQRVAVANQVHLTTCLVAGLTLDVTVSVPARLWPEPARARARAGPGEASPG
jgi:secretion/DNA translocation related TadE-like protein